MNEPKNFCQYCGAPLSPGVHFCEACGQPVPGSSPAPSDETLISPAPLDYSRPSDVPAQLEPEQPPTVLHIPPVTPPAMGTPPPPKTPPYPPYTPPPSPIQPNSPKRPWWIFLIVGVVVVCCLCVAAAVAGYYFFSISSVQTIQDELPVEVPVLVETQAPVETVVVTVQIPVLEAGAGEPEQTEAPQANEEPTPSIEAPTISYEGVSFSFGPEIASAAEGQIIPAATGEDIPPWEITPGHTQFSFSDYILQNTFHNPQIIVYPVEEYAQLSEGVSTIVGDLRRLLAERSMTVPESGLPFLPTWNAAQMMQTQFTYLDFKNGSGIRYLTQYGQAAWPINNESMFYTFQGLTEDGLYYISAIFPVSNPVLPPADSVDLSDDFIDRFPEYVAETEALLDGEPAANFTPEITVLDNLLYSLEIHP